MEQYLTGDLMWAFAILMGVFVLVAAIQLTLETKAYARTQRENDELRQQISSLRDHYESSMGDVREPPRA